jgi:hypothetical protein
MHSGAYPYGITRCSPQGWLFDRGLGGLVKPERSELCRILQVTF